tara:strand:- start:4798 stop:5163 length:366 start_codon:yes stop_codon:yes gene_type:complete
MARRLKITIHLVLTVSLTLALVLSSNLHSASHDPVAIAAIAAQHVAETGAHGHSHEETDSESPSHAFHGHAHDAADHDHNVAFLPPRDASNRLILDSSQWLLALTRTWQGPAFDLDRPPRG